MSDTEPVEDLLELATRFLDACNSLFADALRYEDRPLATQIARDALSVAIDSVTALNYSPGHKLAHTWFGRLQSLFNSSSEKSSAVEKTLKWAEINMHFSAPTETASTDPFRRSG
jgi:hypothetical protein